MVLIIAFAWHSTWNSRGTSWSGVQFLYALVSPCLLSVMAKLLTARDPYAIVSFEDHFARIRRPLFGLLVALAANASLTPWIQGHIPFGAFAPIQAGAIPGVVIGTAGLFARTSRTDAVLVALLISAIGIALITAPTRVSNTAF